MAEIQGAAPQNWTTPVTRLGLEGLQLNKSLDQFTPQELARMRNLFHTGGDLTVRPGLTTLASGAATSLHSIRRLNDPLNATYTRFWGTGSTWARGQSGIISVLKGGFSGHPLTLVPVRPPLSGEPWMLAADSSLMQKASRTSDSLPVGLPAPAGVTVVVSPQLKTPIAAFDASDGTNAAAWVPFHEAPASNPTIFDATGISGNCVNVALVPGAATGAFTSGLALAKALNLSVLPGGVTATDDDFIHIAIRINVPQDIEEIRLYLVCSPFTPPAAGVGYVPGQQSINNTSAYVRSFRPSDYADFVAGDNTALEATATAQQTQALNGVTTPPVTVAGTPASSTLAGSDTWSEFGIVGVSLRRSDFLKVGAAGQAGIDWSTVTGIYITILTSLSASPTLGFDDCYLTGGYGPDDAEADTQPFDYRVTNYDPRTGAESNGSPVQATTAFVDALRQKITVTPSAAFGDAAVRQNAYRRGGTLNDDWQFVAMNAADGGPIVDTFDDAALAVASTIPKDHFQPVATQDAAGNTVLAQPIPIVFELGDSGILCGLGDPYRPGHLYSCISGEPDHWPSIGGYAVEVCAPSEQLMNGGSWADQGFVLSREGGYTVHPDVTGAAGLSVTPNGCKHGLIARWGFVVGPGGVYFVSKAGVMISQGGEAAFIDGDNKLWPLFHATTTFGYAPIDFSVEDAIRLSIYDNELWFCYQGTDTVRQTLIWSFTYRYWRAYDFAVSPSVWYEDENTTATATGALLQIMGASNGSAYTHDGFSDDGTAIPWHARTGAWDFGRPREEKLLGDLIVEANTQGVALTAQTFLNIESVSNTAQDTDTGMTGRARYTFDPFGPDPQHVRNVSLEVRGNAPITARPYVSFAGISHLVEPEITMNRVIAWEPPIEGSTEGYVWGCVLDCDTGGSDRTIRVEGDLGGLNTLITTLTVNSNGRHKQWFSWPAVHAQLLRLRPTGVCEPWMLYEAKWLATPEPPRIAGWDSGFENLGDSYYTGLDLEVDTGGATKLVNVTVDGALLPGSPFAVTASGRQLVHLTFTPGRGHVYHFYGDSTDNLPGLLYTHKWLAAAEPEEQTNWNQNFTTWSSLSDKYLKGFVIEADTFNQVKSVQVQVDGATLQTLSVQHNGRSVKTYTFAQVLGRVFRVLPTDSFPSRLYSLLPLFDEEPYMLARWETQLLDFDLPESGWGSILSADVCYKSAVAATLTMQAYNSSATLMATQTYPLPSTAGVKRKAFVPFLANKGVLFKLVFTTDDASAGLTLYQEESRLRVKPWASSTAMTKPFGNADLDTTRNMVSAVAAAGKSGGGS